MPLKTQAKTTPLTRDDFSFICPLKTEDMSAVEGGYFCQKCDKKVHDVSNMPKDEFEQLKSKSANICVTIQKVATVSLVLGLSACAKPPQEQRLTGKIAPPNTSCDSNLTKTPKKNRLAPFTVVDKNQTIIINEIAEPQIAGGITMAEEIPKELIEEAEKLKKEKDLKEK